MKSLILLSARPITCRHFCGGKEASAKSPWKQIPADISLVPTQAPPWRSHPPPKREFLVVTSYRHLFWQFFSESPSSSSPMMSTAENISATRTAKQQTRAKITMHFCCDWKVRGERTIRAEGMGACKAPRLQNNCVCPLGILNTWLLEKGRFLGENTQGFDGYPSTQLSTPSRLYYGTLNNSQWYPGSRTNLSSFPTTMYKRSWWLQDLETQMPAWRAMQWTQLFFFTHCHK